MRTHGEIEVTCEPNGDVYVVTASMWLDPKKVVIPQAGVQDYLRNALTASLERQLNPPMMIEAELPSVLDMLTGPIYPYHKASILGEMPHVPFVEEQRAKIAAAFYVPPHPIECEGHACRFCAALDHQPCGLSHPDCPRNTEKPE